MMVTQKGPHFLGIGAQRAGTTWVHAMLSAHPDIWLPPIKEVHHFDMFGANGQSISKQRKAHLTSRFKAWVKEPWDKDLLTLQRPETRTRIADLGAMIKYDVSTLIGKPTVDHYTRLFDRAHKRGKTVGEITPAYSILQPDQVANIKDALGPDLKVFFVLRDPIERMWSHATKEFTGFARKHPGDVDAAAYLKFIQKDNCKARTDYATTLATWRNVFGQDNVMACFFDDIREAPQTLIEQIETFLGIQSGHNAELLPPKNSYRKPSEGIPVELRPWLAEFSLQQCAALQKINPHPHIDRWIARAETIAKEV